MGNIIRAYYNNYHSKWTKWFILWSVLFAAIFGGAFGILVIFVHINHLDIPDYVCLSKGEFDIGPVRRYRVIVPFLAAIFRWFMTPLTSVFHPKEFIGDFETIFAFSVVNSMLLAAFFVVVWKLVEEYTKKNSIVISGIATLALLSGRWTFYLAGTAMVDSLYLLCIALLMYGLKKKTINLVLIAIYIGPWSKESFVFFVPLLIFFPIRFWRKLFFHLVISAIIVVSFRMFFDWYIGVDFFASIARDIEHFSSIPISIRRLFSAGGLYELLSTPGIFSIIIFISLLFKPIRLRLFYGIEKYWLFFMLAILFQALLSEDLCRMFYMLVPLWAILIGRSVMLWEEVLEKNGYISL